MTHFNPSSGRWFRSTSTPHRPGKRGGWFTVVGLLGIYILTRSGGLSGKIAYISNEDGDYDIYLMDTAGNRLAQLTNDPGVDAEPEWSADGTRITFTTTRDGDGEVYVMAADGSDPVNLSRNPTDDGGPMFSPECVTVAEDTRCTERIAFHSDRDGDYEIYVMDSSGGDVLQITHNVFTDLWPAWSPDGERLAYMSDQDDIFWEIYVVEIATQQVARYTSSAFVDDLWPAWSPDGSTLAWISGETGWYRVWLMDADCDPACGENKRLLLPNEEDPDAEFEDDVNEFDPNWSPDGDWITFSTARDPASTNPVQRVQFDYEIFIVRVDTTGLTQLTSNENIDDFTPAWTK